MKWTFVKKFRGGHHYFLDEKGSLALADDSGSTPDLTDDGPLWVNPLRYIEYDSHNHYAIPIIDKNGRENQTTARVEEAIWLHGIKHFPMSPTAHAAASELVWIQAMKIMFPNEKH